MPSELEAVMPGYEELPYGYTIGPIDRLAAMSKDERAKYFLENLDKFQETGWMTETTVKKYEAILKNEDLPEALQQAEEDLKNRLITSEIFSIIEGLNSVNS